MRKIITIVFLLLSVVATAQNVKIGETVRVNNDTQRGSLVYNGVKFVPNGIWKANYAKAEYDMGKLLWIKPKGKGKITSQDIQLAQLKRKIIKLEAAIVTLD
jgi:hypothetical protein